MKILDTKTKSFVEKIVNSPRVPGCYLYKDQDGKIIYIGKAKNLRNRLKSYFVNFQKLDTRIQSMIEFASDVEIITVDSEIESIILETNLIKKYLPKYNILMRDDKSHSWVKFEKRIKGKNDFPRIKIVRNKEEDGAEYFGPYPDTMPLKNILKRMRKVFPYASCNRRLVQVSTNPLTVETNNSKPCLYYYLGLCGAPCASLESSDEYMKNFNDIKKFFKGEKESIMKSLEKEMFRYSKDKSYEEARIIRDKINDIKYVTSKIKIGNDVDDVLISKLKKDERDEAIKDLIDQLKFPREKLMLKKDFRIECFDISNIQGSLPVSAMTVLVDGEARPDQYRKFRIRSKDTPDDFLMLQETLERRLKYLVEDKRSKNKSSKMDWNDESFIQKPDLIIIDGGKGQLSATYKILKDFNLHKEIPIVGLAKREEEIFQIVEQIEEMGDLKSNNHSDQLKPKFRRILLKRRSEALFLIQRVRDEAHRFGITYHRKLRLKKMTIVTK